MPKNNAKPWENGGKENGKKKTSRNKPTIKKNDKLSKESLSIFFKNFQSRNFLIMTNLRTSPSQKSKLKSNQNKREKGNLAFGLSLKAHHHPTPHIAFSWSEWEYMVQIETADSPKSRWTIKGRTQGSPPSLSRTLSRTLLKRLCDTITLWWWLMVTGCCLISAKVRYCGADGEEVQHDKHRCNGNLWKVLQKVSQWRN